MDGLTYPVQIVDALRDVMQNVSFHVGAKLKIDHLKGLLALAAYNVFADDGSSLTSQTRINPHAWASRFGRTQAVANAESSVVMCQQMLVDGTLVNADKLAQIKGEKAMPTAAKDQDPWVNMVRWVNENMGLQGPDAWDGYIWPCDLLIALAWALTRMEASGKDAEASNVLSTNTIATGKDGRTDWDDRSSIAELKQRIKIILRGMTWLDLAVLSEDRKKSLKAYRPVKEVIPMDKIDSVVERRLRVKRILDNTRNYFCHCKIVCTDDKLLYVGSDNAYPSYNEEHGIWIDDVETIQRWKTKFWNELFLHRSTDSKN